MNKRLSKIGRQGLLALFVVSVCGASYSCKEDYKLDETIPGYLNSSIYDYLQSKGNYTNFVNLIDDLNYADVLAKTGSKTLFVADDSAFAEFYANNTWGVRNYGELTTSQKKLLLNASMINNAYLIEMMSSTVGPEAGQCLRRETATDVLDSIPHFNAEDLPISYNESDKDYWARFRDPSKGGIYMALDNTTKMMTHFLATQMANKGITDEDFKIIVGRERSKKDAYVFDSKVLEQDITCQNGYINRLDRVLIEPENMAELLRTNGRTKIFSHMVERFSAPFYSQELTQRYNLIYANQVDSVWEKRYFTSHSYRTLLNDKGTDPKGNPNGNTVTYGLTFDPGWNAYRPNDKVAKEQEMATIFAPVDERLYDYFFSANGGGRFLVEAFAPEETAQVKGSDDWENIYRAIDQIPLRVIKDLINNLMKEQFCNSVPSKFETIKNDAQDPMFDETHVDRISDVLLANNGAIYLMDEVITPAEYAAVSAPANYATDMRVMSYAIKELHDGSMARFAENASPTTAKNFGSYLKAMSSRFSFFAPQDGFWYIDPVSFKLGKDKLRAIRFEWNYDKDVAKANSYPLTYDFTTGTFEIDSTKAMSTGKATDAELSNRLNDILETHTIVHTDRSAISGINETETGVECDQHYFLAKNGCPLYVENASMRTGGMRVKGAWGFDHEDSWNTVIRFDDKTSQTNGYGNGMAYEIDSPILPTIESVFSYMYNHQDKFGKFFELCNADNDDILKTIEPFLNRTLDEDGKEVTIYSTKEYPKRYSIFVDNGGLPCFDQTSGDQAATATNIRFFNNYNYTVYLPTNEAIEAAIEKGLPTWESINEVLKIEEGETMLTDEELTEVGPKAAAMVTCLINFIKYHFQDNSVFADTPALNEAAYESATLNSETHIYCKLFVSSAGNGTLTVKDATGHSVNVMSDYKNILTRDYIINANKIEASSPAVVHGIDDVLNYKALSNDRYDSDWATVAAARRYMKKFQIKQ